ncbi:MAG: peptidoglycan DD-metalloendopeptidase family protein [Rikenellaceae bacterium]|nr:peptidoglycan DD-metalloendopeptidase family protein [Rikenellaceae bacterium]
MNKRKIVSGALAAVCLILLTVVIIRKSNYTEEYPDLTEIFSEDIPENLLYGICADSYSIQEDIVKSGESLSVILDRYGLSAVEIDSAVKASENVFNVKSIRGGNGYKAFLTQDTTARLSHFVYEKNKIEYVVFSFGDSITVRNDSKDIISETRVAEAEISSSLWNAMVDNDISPALAMELSEIYAWSIDFFGLQKGDKFKIVFEENYVDSIKVGIGSILGAWFVNNGKKYYAIPFELDGKIKFWDENGNSLRQNLLKAPLSYSRISSTFSHSRLHPVLKIRRPHYGVDYAAPAGTPVYAVADGTVTSRTYTSQGGNTVKIKHSQGLESGYLHLQKFANGLKVGQRVSQGELIGYVGSTGLATGPHLDFRLWKNGKPIDPLKVDTEPAEPIASEYESHFAMVKEAVLGVLEGESQPAEILAAIKSEPAIFRTDSLAMYINGR